MFLSLFYVFCLNKTILLLLKLCFSVSFPVSWCLLWNWKEEVQWSAVDKCGLFRIDRNASLLLLEVSGYASYKHPQFSVWVAANFELQNSHVVSLVREVHKPLHGMGMGLELHCSWLSWICWSFLDASCLRPSFFFPPQILCLMIVGFENKRNPAIVSVIKRSAAEQWFLFWINWCWRIPMCLTWVFRTVVVLWFKKNPIYVFVMFETECLNKPLISYIDFKSPL